MDITFTNKDTIKLAGKSATIVLNPSGEVRADLLLFTSPATKIAAERSFSGPGEYEVMGTMVDGIEIDEANTIYSLVADDIHIIYGVELSAPLTDAQLEHMDDVDILILAVSDDKSDLMNKLIGQIEPKVLIPLMSSVSELDKIKAEFGKDTEPTERYKLTKRDLPEDSQQLVILK